MQSRNVLLFRNWEPAFLPVCRVGFTGGVGIHVSVLT